MKPLQGIRVLDLTQAYSGPFCTMHLADHGAEVIKVESPQGDQSRIWVPFKNDYSAYYSYINRNKKGLRLDLKTDEGKAVLRKLIANADVVCENFRVGVFEKLGFSFDELKKINAHLTK